MMLSGALVSSFLSKSTNTRWGKKLSLWKLSKEHITNYKTFKQEKSTIISFKPLHFSF